jgi:c-di-GMP-related signal transduction protein
MFHGLDVNKAQSIFKFLPVLCFTESYIYQLDDLNEYNLQMVPGNDASLTVLERENRTSNEASLTGMLNVLDDLLQRQGLMTDHLDCEMN